LQTLKRNGFAIQRNAGKIIDARHPSFIVDDHHLSLPPKSLTRRRKAKMAAAGSEQQTTCPAGIMNTAAKR